MVDIRRIPVYRTLTFKVSVALILFFILNGTLLVMWDQADLLHEMETEMQTSYRDMATEVIQDLSHYQTDKQNLSVFFDSISHYYAGMELFLIAEDGEVLDQASHVPSKIINTHVPVQVIKNFLEADTNDYPIEIPVPTATDLDFVFSAAPFKMDGHPVAYVLVTLVEGGADLSLSWWDEYGNILTRAVVFSFVVALIAGLLFWYFLTRRIDRVAHAVQGYRSGNGKLILDDQGSDEIGHVAMHVSHMMSRIDSMFDELGRKEKMRTELLASVSHELQTPLTIMQGHVETLIEHRQKMSEGDFSSKLNAVYSQVSHMSELIDDMFDVAVLETGQMKITPEPFPMVELVEDVLGSYSLLFEQSDLTVVREFSEKVQTVDADPLRIRQVIRNLISNAIKFTKAGGTITIGTRVDPNDSLSFWIKDTGIGIPKDEIENIFESFYRSKQQMNNAVKGTGLGLHICQQILKLHNSGLQVESKPEEGSLFSFDLKLYKEVVTLSE